VEWEDGSPPSWEPEENLTDALIEDYEKELDSEDELLFDLDFNKSHLQKETRYLSRLKRKGTIESDEEGLSFFSPWSLTAQAVVADLRNRTASLNMVHRTSRTWKTWM
jgi:hypothetical protein